jgi:hypothetical protein
MGTLVFANDFRPPVLLAKELATLDQLSEPDRTLPPPRHETGR